MKEVLFLSQTIIEEGFQLMSSSIAVLQQELETSFYDAYIENLENMLDNQKVRVLNGVPSDKVVKTLEEKYQRLSNLALSAEEKRKVAQLVLLQGMKKEPMQANHQLTPDGIGFLFVYMIEQLFHDQKELRIADLTVGTGNLLATIMTNLTLANYTVEGYGVDVDDTLLSIGAVTSGWLALETTLFHQDSLQALLLDPVDVAVADLPIGYYPDDTQAQTFVASVAEGHSYAHHLLIEQTMKYVHEAGFGLFLLPTNFLETEQADAFKKWMKETVYLQAILKLPDTLFSQKGLSKSIVIFQNHGAEAKQASEVFLAELPSLKNGQALLTVIQEFKAWRQAMMK